MYCVNNEGRRSIYNQEKIIKCLEEELTEKERLVTLKAQNLKKQRENFSDSKRKADEVKKSVEKIKVQINEVRQQRKEEQKRLSEINYLIQTSEKLLKSMNDIILIHTSAMLYQLYKHQCERIWVSEADEEFFSDLEERTGGLFSVEQVYCEEYVTDIVLPGNMFQAYTKLEKDELKSIVSFCKMALYLKINKKQNQQVFLAHRNSLIRKILKLNGIDGFKF